jgi:hypothetical protein
MGALPAAIGGILGEALGRRADLHMRGEVGGGCIHRALRANDGGRGARTCGRRSSQSAFGILRKPSHLAGGGESGQEGPFCPRYKGTIELGAALGSAP